MPSPEWVALVYGYLLLPEASKKLVFVENRIVSPKASRVHCSIIHKSLDLETT